MKNFELTTEWNHCATIGRWICFQYYRGELRRCGNADTDWIVDIVETLVRCHLEWLRLMNGEYTKRRYQYLDACLGPIVDQATSSIDGSAPLRRDELMLYAIVGRRFLVTVAQR